MDAVVDEVFGIQLLSELEPAVAENFFELRVAIALFCSCRDDAKSDPVSTSEQMPTVLIVFMSFLLLR